MSEERKPPYKRQILDDIFDAYTILGKGTYVSLYDAVGQMTRYSPASVELFGLKGEYIPAGADNWGDFVHPEDRKRYESIMAKLVVGTAKYYDLHYRVRLRDGSYSLFRFVGSILRDQTGKPELIGGIMINEGLIENTDSVTALRNHYGFFQDINTIMELQKKCTILMIGISKMDNINESHGYSFGNRLLQQMSWLLQEELEQYGKLYRMEGSKFVFLTESLIPEEVAQKYELLRQKVLNGLQVGNIRQNLIISGGMISIGGKSMNERAIYSSLSFVCRESRLHKNGSLVNFNGSLKRGSRETLEMIDEIRNNVLLYCEGFSMKYQAVVDTNTEKIIGIESMINYHSNRFGDIETEEYLPILERDFVFEELGYWVLQQSMIDGRKLLDKKSDLIVGVNIVQVQLEDEFFVDELQKIAKKTEFPLKNLCLELNKTCRLLDMDFLKNIIVTLRKKGVKIMIDDFGSGLASIDFLRELAPDYIKFDKKYIAEFNKVENRQIIRCLSELAIFCGTKVCIDGIENQDICNIVKRYPINHMQGNLYAPPLPLPEITEKFFK